MNRGLVIATALLMTSCSYGPTIRPPEPAYVRVALSADSTWHRILEMYTDLEFPIETVDRASWFIRSGLLAIPELLGADVADCGGGWLGKRADNEYVRARATILLRPGRDSTGIRVVAGFSTSGFAECVSRGKLERGLLRMITAGRALPWDSVIR